MAMLWSTVRHEHHQQGAGRDLRADDATGVIRRSGLCRQARGRDRDLPFQHRRRGDQPPLRGARRGGAAAIIDPSGTPRLPGPGRRHRRCRLPHDRGPLSNPARRGPSPTWRAPVSAPLPPSASPASSLALRGLRDRPRPGVSRAAPRTSSSMFGASNGTISGWRRRSRCSSRPRSRSRAALSRAGSPWRVRSAIRRRIRRRSVKMLASGARGLPPALRDILARPAVRRCQRRCPTRSRPWRSIAAGRSSAGCASHRGHTSRPPSVPGQRAEHGAVHRLAGPHAGASPKATPAAS